MPYGQKFIPPTHKRVKAGFVLFTPGDDAAIFMLEEGELAAKEVEAPYGTVFSMHPGDLVGVASLLTREPFKYKIVATKDSSVTIINEECMESELKQLPLWLLALIRSLSSKTFQLKKAAVQTRVTNTLKSLAEFLSKKPEHIEFNLADLVREFQFLTKIPSSVAGEDFKSLLRRNLIKMRQKEGHIYCTIFDRELLKILVDFLNTNSKIFPPFKLSYTQKKILKVLYTEDALLTCPSWINLLKSKIETVEISDWINMQKMGWFKENQQDLFCVNKNQIAYFLKALYFENNIRGFL